MTVHSSKIIISSNKRSHLNENDYVKTDYTRVSKIETCFVILRIHYLKLFLPYFIYLIIDASYMWAPELATWDIENHKLNRTSTRCSMLLGRFLWLSYIGKLWKIWAVTEIQAMTQKLTGRRFGGVEQFATDDLDPHDGPVVPGQGEHAQELRLHGLGEEQSHGRSASWRRSSEHLRAW